MVNPGLPIFPVILLSSHGSGVSHGSHDSYQDTISLLRNISVPMDAVASRLTCIDT